MEVYSFTGDVPSWVFVLLRKEGIDPYNFSIENLSDKEVERLDFITTLLLLERKGLVKVEYAENKLKIRSLV